jgi:hypothetical protein
MTTKSSTSEMIKGNEKENFQKILNSIRRDVINSRKYFSFNDDHKSGAMALDFMVEKYELDHLEVIEYMRSVEVQNLMLNHVPEKGRGYIQAFVKQNGNSFNPYMVKFIPFNIIQKEWGLGYKNTKTDDFVFFECLYENDHTKFRGCFSK